MSGGLIELPWPPTDCSPNARHGNHWAKTHAAAKYRAECLLLLGNQPVPAIAGDDPIMLNLTFCPPTKRLSDLDNLLARTKQGVDALAERMGVDDKRFWFTLKRGDPVKFGKVVVEIGQ